MFPHRRTIDWIFPHAELHGVRQSFRTASKHTRGDRHARYVTGSEKDIPELRSIRFSFELARK